MTLPVLFGNEPLNHKKDGVFQSTKRGAAEELYLELGCLHPRSGEDIIN